MGLLACISSYPQGQDNSEWLQRSLLAFISTENWPCGSAGLNPLDSKLWAVWRTWHAESIATAWRAWSNPSWRQQKRSPWRQCVQWQQSGRSVSRLALRQRVAILSDSIINERLKLLQINYLAQNMDVLFNFPSRSHYTCIRTYGESRYVFVLYGSRVQNVLSPSFKTHYWHLVFVPLLCWRISWGLVDSVKTATVQSGWRLRSDNSVTWMQCIPMLKNTVLCEWFYFHSSLV